MLTYQGRQIPETIDEILDPKHTALIVHEMLNDFCAKGGAYDRAGIERDVSGIVRPIKELIKEARAQGIRVFFVRYTIGPDYSSYSDFDVWRSRDLVMNPDRPPPPLVEGTWGWENIDELKPKPGDIIVRKYRVDAFFETPLDVLLKWNGIKTIVLTGIGAEIGLVPTVIHAANIGYFSVTVKDAIIAGDHSRFDDTLKYFNDWGIVKDHADVLDVWRPGGS